MFATDEYSKEDLEYMAKVFLLISYKTIWRTFESCNNYRMPEGTIEYLGKLEYWYGDKERKERAKDLAYVKEHFHTCKVYRNEKYGTRQYGDIISRKHGRTYYGFSKVRSCSK